MKILLDLSDTLPNQNLRIPEWFLREWVTNAYSKGWQTTSAVVNDMEHWFWTTTCRNTDDNLYRKVLCGVYVYVKNDENWATRLELMKRVFEECQESVGMCCEGHLSRLCNVLVGFDDRFEQSVALGEKIQNEMAKIAMKEAETDVKVKEANAFFDEHKVPDGDRTAWLEAF